MAHVTVNGSKREIADQTTIAQLLEELELKQQRVAVEVNMEIVPFQDHGQYVLNDGDELEVVTLVGGG